VLEVNEPAVVNEVIDGEAVILNLENGRYYSLRGVGEEIWSAIGARRPYAAIVADLRARYADDGIESHVARLLDELREEGLVRRAATNGAGRAAGAEPGSGEESFDPPVLERYTDMEDVLLLDPVHEVEPEGWPHRR
jgi:hypothetical protein